MPLRRPRRGRPTETEASGVVAHTAGQPFTYSQSLGTDWLLATRLAASVAIDEDARLTFPVRPPGATEVSANFLKIKHQLNHGT